MREETGGEDKPIDHIAKRLYGNLLNTYKRCEIKDTALSNYFLHKHGAYKPQNYEQSGLKAKNLVEGTTFREKIELFLMKQKHIILLIKKMDIMEE